MSNIPYSLNSRFSTGIGIGRNQDGKVLAAGMQYPVRQNVNLRSSIAWNNANNPVINAVSLSAGKLGKYNTYFLLPKSQSTLKW
nr:hypothetical protein [Providencia sp. PROV129]